VNEEEVARGIIMGDVGCGTMCSLGEVGVGGRKTVVRRREERVPVRFRGRVDHGRREVRGFAGREEGVTVRTVRVGVWRGKISERS